MCDIFAVQSPNRRPCVCPATRQQWRRGRRIDGKRPEFSTWRISSTVTGATQTSTNVCPIYQHATERFSTCRPRNHRQMMWQAVAMNRASTECVANARGNRSTACCCASRRPSHGFMRPICIGQFRCPTLPRQCENLKAAASAADPCLMVVWIGGIVDI